MIGIRILEHGFDGLDMDLFACGDGILEHGFEGLDTDFFACGDGIFGTRMTRIRHGFD